MIHVDLKKEPENFKTLVRQPGHNFISRTPGPTTAQWKSHSYWQRVLIDMRRLYGDICAYSCHWIPPDTGAATIEHFLPKSRYPEMAYEWDNYRLVCSRLNGWKKDHEDVLDPFYVQTGWFTIDFPSCQVKPAMGLGEDLSKRVKETIDRLGLNDEGTCLKTRERYVKDFCQGCINFDYLCNNAPFIALELERQGLVSLIKEIMGYPQEACVL